MPAKDRAMATANEKNSLVARLQRGERDVAHAERRKEAAGHAGLQRAACRGGGGEAKRRVGVRFARGGAIARPTHTHTRARA